ncbi:MAG: nucleotide exchange factor GrpE [Flavobacteriales bacterium]
MSERPDGTAAEQSPDNSAPLDLQATTEAAAGRPVNDDPPAGENDRLRGELDALRIEHAALHDKYVRLHAEFDNFRKRTAKERLELLQTAGADALKSVLPALDDMERAIANNTNVTDAEALKQGFVLIHQKFANLLAAQGMKPMQAKGEAFDPDVHEAITKAPAPSPDLKGKVIDVIENGYTLNDKVVRYAKVVVGE